MGAVSIVNAVASGRGATLAVNLPTSAKVSLSEKKGGWQVFANGTRLRSSLAIHTVYNTIKMLGKSPSRYSGTLETRSSVPMGVGLKTSSSSSVAIALAVLSAFGKRTFDSDGVLDVSANSSLMARVSLTGALDDAASCLMGGVNYADNLGREVLSTSRLGRTLPVLIKIPEVRSRRTQVPISSIRRFSNIAESIFSTGMEGRTWKAMTLNGLLCCSIYGYPPDDSMDAIGAKALGAGLSGTGPAVGAVFNDKGDLERLAAKWGDGGAKLIRTETTDDGASIGI